MIHSDHTGKCYPDGFEALNNLSFDIAQGDMAFLTGHSGAGKSTVLKLIMLMERASSGQVRMPASDCSSLAACWGSQEPG